VKIHGIDFGKIITQVQRTMSCYFNGHSLFNEK